MVQKENPTEQGTASDFDNLHDVNQAWCPSFHLPPLPSGSHTFQQVLEEMREENANTRVTPQDLVFDRSIEGRFEEKTRKKLFHRRFMVKGTHVYVFLSYLKLTCNTSGRCQQATTTSFSRSHASTSVSSPAETSPALETSTRTQRQHPYPGGTSVNLPPVRTRWSFPERKPRSVSEPTYHDVICFRTN